MATRMVRRAGVCVAAMAMGAIAQSPLDPSGGRLQSETLKVPKPTRPMRAVPNGATTEARASRHTIESAVVGQRAVAGPCTVANVPAAETGGVNKNRYASLEPTNPGQQTALSMTLTASAHFPGSVGAQWWIGAPDPVTGRAALQCTPHYRDWGAGPAVIHVGDPNIHPAGLAFVNPGPTTYEVRAILQGCDTGEPNDYSPPLSIDMSNLGDLVGSGGSPWPPPNGGPSNFDDLRALIQRFQGRSDAAAFERVNLDPEVIQADNGPIDAMDVWRVAQAFVGIPFAFNAPRACPFTAPACGNSIVEPGEECDDGGTTPGDGCDTGCQYERIAGELALVPVGGIGNQITVSVGQTVTLELRVKDWDPGASSGRLLNVVQAQLDSSGLTSGTQGALTPVVVPCPNFSDCEAVLGPGSVCVVLPEVPRLCTPGFHDSSRADKVHGDPLGFGFVDLSTGDYRYASMPFGVGPVDDGSEKYLGTLVLNVAADAEGLFTVGFDASGTFFVDQADDKFGPVTLTPAQITVIDVLQAADDGLGGDYNRVGDFKAPTSGEVAIRVTLDRMYIDSDEDPATGCPVRQGLPDLQLFEGQVRYLGPPEVFDNNAALDTKWVGAKLQCTPVVRDWSASSLAAELGISQSEADTIYYYGAEVVPCSIHAVQQATQSCVDSASEGCFSDPLEVRTAMWGDTWPLPPGAFGNVNFGDIRAEVDAFKSIPFVVGPPPSGAPNKWRAMLRNNEGAPDSDINFNDIGKCVDAFKTIGYPADGPTACP